MLTPEDYKDTARACRALAYSYRQQAEGLTWHLKKDIEEQAKRFEVLAEKYENLAKTAATSS